VEAVSLGNVATSVMAQGAQAVFSMQYKFFGNHQASFGVDTAALYSDFNTFFTQYLKHLFR
jgi:hypothetical protein